MYFKLVLVFAVTWRVLHGSFPSPDSGSSKEIQASYVTTESPASGNFHTELISTPLSPPSSSASSDGLTRSTITPSAPVITSSTSSVPAPESSSPLTSSSEDTTFGIELYASASTETTTRFSFSLEAKPERYYYWDKAKLSAKEYQQNYCLSRCDGNERVRVMAHDGYCRDIDCILCECERPSCEVYGICCPDITEPFIEIEARSFLYLLNLPEAFYPNDSTGLPSESATTNAEGTPAFEMSTSIASNKSYMTPTRDIDTDDKRSREDPELFCDNDSNPKEDVYLYIRSCPSDFTNANVRQMCEEKTPNEKMSTDTYVRVADRATNAIYYNQRCAECNGVTKMVLWELNIDCWHNMRVYPATNLQELLRLALREDSKCTTTQDVPHDVKTLRCEADYYGNITDTCNVTGLWKDYDEDVRRACEGDQFSSVIYRAGNIYKRGLPHYKNVFCYICNQELYPIGRDSCHSEHERTGGDNPPFSLLLGFRELRNRRTYVSPFVYSTNCTDEEWASPNGDCLPLQCSPGKRLDGSACFTALPTITGLGYRLRVWFVPQNNISPSFVTGYFRLTMWDALNSFMQQMEDLVARLTEEYDLKFGMNFNVPTNAASVAGIPDEWLDDSRCLIPNSCFFLYAWVEGVLVANRTFLRDDFENNIIQRYLNATIRVKITNQVEVLLQPTLTIMKSDRWYCDDSKEAHGLSTCVSLHIKERSPPEEFPTVFDDIHLFLNITNTLQCSFISFDTSSYTMTKINDSNIPPGVLVTVNLQVANITFTEAAEFSQLYMANDGKLDICVDLLDEKLLEIETLRRFAFYRKLRFESQADASTFAQYVLSLICMSSSMICLAVTLLTYFRFSVLLNVAGKNNVFLCANLLMAQGFLLAAAHVSGPNTLCTILGILTHFMWLCMFCWSFICCFHMFRVFTARARNPHSTSRSEKAQLVKRVVTSVLVPALVIVTIMVASYVTSDREDIGYGDNACYLDTDLLVGVSMILPLALVIVCNVAFFTITVVKIHNIRKLQSHDSFKKEDRQNLFIYIKLSTITGTFWAIFIVAEAVDLDPLRFLAIVLNGLQGVFIFISYMCNMRVLNLYRQSLGLEPLSMTSTSKQHPKTELTSQGKSASWNCNKSNNNSSSNTERTDEKTLTTAQKNENYFCVENQNLGKGL